MMFHFNRSILNISLLLFMSLSLASPKLEAQADLKNHDAYQAIDISADHLDVKEKKGQALFKGNVKVVQGKLNLSSNELIVFYAKNNQSENPSIERLDVKGAVILTSNSEIISGDWGVYDVTKRLITVGGNVQLKRGENILEGARLELDLTSGLAKLDGKASDKGRVTGRFEAPKKIQP